MELIIKKDSNLTYINKTLNQNQIMNVYNTGANSVEATIVTEDLIIQNDENVIEKFNYLIFCELIKNNEYKDLITQFISSKPLFSQSFLKSLNNDEDYESRFKYFSERLTTLDVFDFLRAGVFHPNNLRCKTFIFYSDDFENIKKIFIDQFNMIQLKSKESKKNKDKSFIGLLNSSIIEIYSNESFIKKYKGQQVSFTIHYHQKEEKLYEKLFELFESSTVKLVYDESSVYLLKLTKSGDLLLNEFSIINKHTNIDLNYNDDFKDIDKQCKNILENSPHGLILFHSDPGSGKSSYLYYLCSFFKNKRKIIYIPSNMLYLMDDSKFHDLLSSNPRSVIVMEDSENVLISREDNRNSMVQTLLNYTDGFLAEIFEPIFICTFNIDIKNIDKALLRKGRCLLKYEFKKLEVEKGQNLSNHLGFNTKISEPMILTDIYNQEEEAYTETKREKIGYF